MDWTAGFLRRSAFPEIEIIPAGINSFKGHNGKTKTNCKICSNFTIKTREMTSLTSF